MKAAIGFRGGVAVTLAEPPAAPRVVDRRLIGVRDGQPYHAARRMELAAAEEFIREEEALAERRARRGLEAIVGELRPRGIELSWAGILVSTYELPRTLAAMLASHPACHGAEGQMTRDALCLASEALGLALVAVAERDVMAQASAALGIAPEELPNRLAELGKPVGPPWRKDEKLAASVAWLALAGQ